MTESHLPNIPPEPQPGFEEGSEEPPDVVSEPTCHSDEQSSAPIAEQAPNLSSEQPLEQSVSEQTSTIISDQTTSLLSEKTSDPIVEPASERLVSEQTIDPAPSEQTSDPISPDKISDIKSEPTPHKPPNTDNNITPDQTDQVSSTGTPDDTVESASKDILANNTGVVEENSQHTDSSVADHGVSGVESNQTFSTSETDDVSVSGVKSELPDSAGSAVTASLSAAEDESERNEETESIDYPSSEEMLDPVVEKLMLFLKDSSRREIEFAGDISSHERFLVHKFVQEHGLSCESTGSNANHKFVVAKGDEFEPDAGAEGIQDGDIIDDQDSLDENFVEIDSNIEATDTSDSNPDLWFNPDNTGAANTSVTLKALKLENFAAIYRNGRDHLEDSLKEICQVVEIPFRLEECLDSQQNVRTSLYMNNIHVSDGFSNESCVAKQHALQTAVLFLTKKLGLPLTASGQCEFRKVKARRFGNTPKHDDRYKESFQQYLEQEFLNNSDLEQLRVMAPPKISFNDAGLWQTKLLLEIAHKFKLQTEIKGRLLWVSKVNSVWHKIPVLPHEQPAKRLRLVRNQGTKTLAKQKVVSKKLVDQTETERSLNWKQIIQDGWDPSKVNTSLDDLGLLNMNEYHAVILKDVDGPTVIKQIAKSLGVACRFKFADRIHQPDYDPRYRWHGALFLNKIYIAEDYGGLTTTVPTLIANTALPFLISKGLKVIHEDEICDEQIKKVYREDFASGNYHQHFSAFLQNKVLLMMKFCLPLNNTEKELIITMCESNNLDFRYEGGIAPMSVLKRDSRLHKMKVERKAVLPPGTIVVSTDDLKKEPSIRNHVEKFVECDSLKEIQFPDNLDGLQRELIEVLAEKYKLQFGNNHSGSVILSKVGSGVLCLQNLSEEIQEPSSSNAQRLETDTTDIYYGESSRSKRRHPHDFKNFKITKTFRRDRDEEAPDRDSFTGLPVAKRSRSMSRNTDELLDSPKVQFTIRNDRKINNHSSISGSASQILLQNRNRTNSDTRLNSFDNRRRSYHDNFADDMELHNRNDFFNRTSSISPLSSHPDDDLYHEDSRYSSASYQWSSSFSRRRGKYRKLGNRM